MELQSGDGGQVRSVGIIAPTRIQTFAVCVFVAPFFFAVLMLCRIIMPVVARLAGRLRAKAGIVRSVWGVTPILTLPLLAKADALLGIKSESFVFQTYYITREFDRNLSASAAWFSRWAPALTRWYYELVFLLTLPRYDIYHYFNDRGLMQPEKRFGICVRELRYLERTGRQLYTYAYGADVRERQATMALGKWNFCRDCDDPGRYCVCDAAELGASLRPVARSARAMNTMGDMLIYVPRGRNMHYWPIDVDRVAAVGGGVQARKRSHLLLAHAPNHGHFKGTSYIMEAVASLQKRGLDIELVTVQHVSNSKVLEVFARADVVIDQLIGGFHGYTALEAMALGKPVISYLRSPELVFPECPIISATPDSIESVLGDIYSGIYNLAALGRGGLAYVQKNYSIEAVAIRLAEMYLSTAVLSPTERDSLTRARGRLSTLANRL